MYENHIGFPVIYKRSGGGQWLSGRVLDWRLGLANRSHNANR